MQKRIIDKRKKEKYMLDDEYLNGMARLCGWKGTIVYNSLCRHVDNEQQCFPSLELIAEQHGVSRPTVLNGIEELVKRNVIFVEKIRSKNGKWLNNSYTLIDKLEWDYSIKATKNKRGTNQKKVNGKFVQVNDTDTVTKSVRIHHQVNDTDTSQVNDTDTKETHKQGNTYKETHREQSSQAFESFWEEYPNKKDKKKSLILWNKLKPSKETIEKIMSSLKQQKKSKQWKEDNGKFIPHPSTWLNGERWTDVVKTKSALTSKYEIYDRN